MNNMNRQIAVIIPCFCVKSHILAVLAAIGDEVSRIFVVDDFCPEQSGHFVEEQCNDPRVTVIYNSTNLGVGGAVLAGYRAAIAANCGILVKIDGDGQMDPAILGRIAAPVINGRADYAKGNRFYSLTHISRMPKIRIFGNAALAFMSKFSTGYWQLFDPTNGYTAIDARIAAHLPMQRISKRYFFETDMLFRLNVLRAVVVDVPMDPLYADEKSNLHIRNILLEFFGGHLRNFGKRIFYNYFLRDMSLASLELLAGMGLLMFGAVYGGVNWHASLASGQTTPLGIIMLASLPIILGLQFLLAFFAFDIASTPSQPVSGLLPQEHE